MTDLRKAAEDMLETLDKPFTASKTIFQAKEALRQALAQSWQEHVSEGLVDYIGRKLRVKTTKGKPDLKNAPRWATALGQTPQGAWHWLEKNGPIETPDSNRYFPLSGKTEFTGFVSKYEGKQGVEEECWACGCDECVCADRLPKRPLTDAEAFLAMGKIPLQKHITDDFILAVVRATEAAHGIRGEK